MQDENLGQMYDLKFSSSFINIYEKIWQLFNNIFYVIWYIQNITSACNRYTFCEDTLKDPTDCGGHAMPSLLDGVGWSTVFEWVTLQKSSSWVWIQLLWWLNVLRWALQGLSGSVSSSVQWWNSLPSALQLLVLLFQQTIIISALVQALQNQFNSLNNLMR